MDSLDPQGVGVPYIKIIKLLYIADREMLRQKKRTITGDHAWSMRYGPVLQNTLDLIKGDDAEWLRHFVTDLDAKIVILTKPFRSGALSRSELQVLDHVVEAFGHLPWQELVAITHQFPEWKRVKQGRARITVADMARGVGFNDAEAHDVANYTKELDAIREYQEELVAMAAR